MATDGLLTGATSSSSSSTCGRLAAPQLDKDASTREVLLGSGDVTLNEDPQLGTLRSTLAEVIASAMEANCALDCDFTVVNGKGDFPSPELLRTRLMAL